MRRVFIIGLNQLSARVSLVSAGRGQPGGVRGLRRPRDAVRSMSCGTLLCLFQQDVSEFTHKLLDWLEDAFQLAVSVR